MTAILPDTRQYIVVPTLTIIEYYILATLARDALHGLGVFEMVARWTDSQMVLIPGTLYAALKRMYSEDWITVTDPPPGQHEDQRRKLYRLTPKGYGVLRDYKRWAAYEAQRDPDLFPDMPTWFVPSMAPPSSIQDAPDKVQTSQDTPNDDIQRSASTLEMEHPLSHSDIDCTIPKNGVTSDSDRSNTLQAQKFNVRSTIAKRCNKSRSARTDSQHSHSTVTSKEKSR